MSRPVLIRKFVTYLYPYWALEFFILGLMVIGGAGSLATPFFLKIIIDDVFPEGNYTQLLLILLTLIVIYVIRIVCAAATDILYSKLSGKIIGSIREDIVSCLLTKPLSFFKNIKSGELIYNIVNDVENIQTALSYLVLHFLNNCIQIAGIVIMLAILNFELTVISLAILPFIIISIKKLTPHLQSSYRKIQAAQERLNTFVLEIIKNIRVINSYGTYEYEKQRARDIQETINKTQVRNAFLNSINSNITTFFVAIGPIIVLMYGGKDVFTGTMTIGALIAFIQYLNRLYAPTISVMDGYNHFVKAFVSMEKVIPFLEREVTSKSLPLSAMPPEFGEICFERVGYADNGITVLSNINIRLKRGKTYAFYGPSGAGKSTIVNLLCGFIKPSTGEIYVDNKYCINDLPNWAAAFALIEKENQLFNDTIWNNVRYGSFEKGDNQIRRAIENASLQRVINQLPGEDNTVLNESGLSLSDGQKQRISIARALLKDPPIFIFDEATASLDSDLEKEIFGNIRRACPDSMIVFITHRLSSIGYADFCYKVENGFVSDDNIGTKQQQIATKYF